MSLALCLSGFCAQDSCRGPYLTFVFDDGFEDVYRQALPLFEKYDIAATAYVITAKAGDYFGGRKVMSWGQIKGLSDAGWEIASHTMRHPDLTKISLQDAEAELKDSQALLKGKGYAAESLSIPYGKYNNAIKEIAKKYYRSARPSEWGVNSLRNLDVYHLKSFWVTNITFVDEMKSWIDCLQQKDDWAIIMLHAVSTDMSIEYAISPRDLEKIIRYAKAKNISVKTISRVLDCVQIH